MGTAKTTGITYYITIRGYELKCHNCGEASNLSPKSKKATRERWGIKFVKKHKDCPIPEIMEAQNDVVR